jgi:hypothetical protein
MEGGRQRHLSRTTHHVRAPQNHRGNGQEAEEEEKQASHLLVHGGETSQKKRKKKHCSTRAALPTSLRPTSGAETEAAEIPSATQANEHIPK